VERRKRIASMLSNINLEDIKKFYKSFYRQNPSVKNGKSAMIAEIAHLFAFKDVNAFNDCFYTLPPLAQKIVRNVIFWIFVPLKPYEEESNGPLVIQEKRYAWSEHIYEFVPELHLDFLKVYKEADQLVAFTEPVFREILRYWLAPPPGGDLTDCIAAEVEGTRVWSNAVEIADSLPLLCDVLPQAIKDMDQGKAVHGFGKRNCNELRASSGFMPFTQSEYAPDSADLAARFILCMTDFNPERPKDGHLGLRRMIGTFFDGKQKKSTNRYSTDQGYLEYYVLLDHLSKKPGMWFVKNEVQPPSRIIFRQILLALAKDGRRFDVDLLAAYIRFNYDTFYFCDNDIEHRMKLRADCITAKGIAFKKDQFDTLEFSACNIMRFELLAKPLFKAYCYLFAALGLLEITQNTPELNRSFNAKTSPLSPYDSIKTIRITELGRWCLGLTEVRPPVPERKYEAIADRELRLVTVQGTSLERTIYLDRVGVRLGENRWRISPASFISGCQNKKQIEERIDKFVMLIDPDPAPHWKALFAQVVSRTGIFDTARQNAVVYRLPDDRALVEELLADPVLREVAMRAERGLLVVPAKNMKKFTAFLAEHGIAYFLETI
jgi:hypothetical protein